MQTPRQESHCRRRALCSTIAGQPHTGRPAAADAATAAADACCLPAVQPAGLLEVGSPRCMLQV